MDKFGIFNILNSLSNLLNKNNNSSTQNTEKNQQPNNDMFSQPKKPEVEKTSAELRAELPPLQANMIGIMQNHDAFVKRVEQRNKKTKV